MSNKYSIIVYKIQIPGVIRKLTIEDQNHLVGGAPLARKELIWGSENLWQMYCDDSVHPAIVNAVGALKDFDVIEIDNDYDDEVNIQNDEEEIVSENSFRI